MSDKEISLVLGTAGHIDHGKTALIKALTGVDCDRLVEEKKRGITIELGFAPLKLPSGRIISIVDVPGHEKFIRQMVAGVSGIDAVLFVVAADEGVMPQTREHLDILKLLAIHEGFVVLTKADLVDEETIEMATEEVRDLLKGTFLENSDIIPVSSSTGANLDKVVERLEKLVSSVHVRSRRGPFFMPIDRAFPVAGFGTVVTGTAYTGKISLGEEIEVLPLEKPARIRSIQVHSSAVDEAWAGQRVAMSLAGIAVDDIGRGDVVCEKGLFRKTNCFDTFLNLLSSSPEPLSHWQRIRLHIGTSDVLGRVSLLGCDEILPGHSGFAQIVTEEDIVVSFSERFIIRFYSPLVTIGGGEVLFPYGYKPRGRASRNAYVSMLQKMKGADSTDEKLSVIVEAKEILPFGEAAMIMQESAEKLANELVKLQEKGEIFTTDTAPRMIFSRKAANSYIERIESVLETYHDRNPYSTGMPVSKLAGALIWKYDVNILKSFLSYLGGEKIIRYEDGVVRNNDFEPLNEALFHEKKLQLQKICYQREFQFPTIEELRSMMDMEKDVFSSFLDKLKKDGDIVLLQGTLVLYRDIEVQFINVLKDMEIITIGSVRDKIGSSRKFILPVLEYLDSKKITRRVGDKRVLLRNLQ